MSSPGQTLTARWIFPVSSAPLANGIIGIEGEKIIAVEPRGTRKADVDLGDAVIIPGLVNAHTHLDLSAMRGIAPPRLPLPDWLSDVIGHRQTTTREETMAAIRAGLEECIRTGTTLIGDIAGGGLSWEILASSGVWATVYYELIGMSEERVDQARESLNDFVRQHQDEETSHPCRMGFSPHAPYSTSQELFGVCSGVTCPIATHLAETREELDLLAHRRGPFVAFMERLGAWYPDQLIPGVEEILGWFGEVTSPCVVAHGNYLSAGAPISPYTTIVYCPRTHAAFGHAPHPFREFLARGVRVALGTDSLASNPDLDLLAEARFLRRNYSDVSGATLLRMATLAGAEALDWGETTGSLEVGKSADLVVIPTNGRDSDDPHELFLSSDKPVARVMCRGRWLKVNEEESNR